MMKAGTQREGDTETGRDRERKTEKGRERERKGEKGRERKRPRETVINVATKRETEQVKCIRRVHSQSRAPRHVTTISHPFLTWLADSFRDAFKDSSTDFFLNIKFDINKTKFRILGGVVRTGNF